MPIFYQQDVDAYTRMAVWKIEEEEEFFLRSVPLARSIAHPHKRLQHLAGRYLLRYLFADFPVDLIRIADTRKPFLENEAYHFSISHCGDYAAVIVSSAERVGVDIEMVTEKVDRISQKFLHTEELTELQQNGGMHTNMLTLLWCCKEAVFKWWSYGKVDFREQIRLLPTSMNERGVVKASFIGETETALTLHYRAFDGMCLAWVKT